MGGWGTATHCARRKSVAFGNGVGGVSGASRGDDSLRSFFLELVAEDLRRTYAAYMLTLSATELRGNLYRVLERILRTGRPVEVVIKGQRLLISPTKVTSKWDQLEPHAQAVTGDSDDLATIEWSKSWTPHL